MTIIDAHQHFWKYNAIRDSWIDDTMGVLKKDFLPMDLKLILQNNDVNGCIAVQADQSEDETRFLLELAKKNPFIKGVVGWVDLLDPKLQERLSFFSNDSFLKGIRHIVQAELPGFMLTRDFQNGIAKLGSHDLVYDVLVFPSQLPEATKLVAKFENQPFVIDHLGKPNIKDKLITDWERDITNLAAFPNVFCKLSGMVTEANWNNWSVNDFEPYINIVLERFGADRVIFGSDWPVCLLSASYNEVITIIQYYMRFLSENEKAKIMGENAVRIYNLKI